MARPKNQVSLPYLDWFGISSKYYWQSTLFSLLNIAFMSWNNWGDYITVDSIKAWLKSWEKAGPSPFLLVASARHKQTTKVYCDNSKYCFVIDCFISGWSCKENCRHSAELNCMIANSISEHPAGVRAESVISFIQTANINTFPDNLWEKCC